MGGEELFSSIIKLFFFLPEAKKAICENLFACLFSTIKCKILLPVSGLCHMSLPVTKPACLLMNPIRGKDLERFKGTEFLVQYFSVEKLLVCCSCCTWKLRLCFLYEFAKFAMEREQEETLREKKSHCDPNVLHVWTPSWLWSAVYMWLIFNLIGIVFSPDKLIKKLDGKDTLVH